MNTPAEQPRGRRMRQEIAEQPDRWQDLLLQEGEHLTRLREEIWSRPPRLVLFVARGTSDNAAVCADYLVQTSLGLPSASASPSAVTMFGARLDLRDVLLVAISQSGESPDIVSYVEMARAGGATTLGLTNAPGSALAKTLHHVVDLHAGPETAVAATKSYTAELLALTALFAPDDVASELADLHTAARDVLSTAGPAVVDLADRYRYTTRVMTAGRGFSSASAREAALKLMETSYVSAHGMSAADLLHGPIALLDESVPLLCFASAGPDSAVMTELVELGRGQGVDVEVIGDGTVTPSTLPPLLPSGLAPQLRPLLEVLPAQLLAAEMALARGIDPDRPRGLSKVTRTY
jgi:glucosamine--fructose-6-phosphate aminotransferase (isomerizing)